MQFLLQSLLRFVMFLLFLSCALLLFLILFALVCCPIVLVGAIVEGVSVVPAALRLLTGIRYVCCLKLCGFSFSDDYRSSVKNQTTRTLQETRCFALCVDLGVVVILPCVVCSFSAHTHPIL